MPGPASSFDTYKSDIMNRPSDKRAAAAERHLDLLTQMRSSLQQEFITRLEGTHRIMGNSRSYQSILDTLKAIESIMDTSITANTEAYVREYLTATYAQLIQQCDEYLASHSGRRYTSVGKRRVILVRALKKKADDEAQLLMERLDSTPSFDSGLTLRQLFAGMRPLQAITAQPKNFTLPKAPVQPQAAEPDQDASDAEVEAAEQAAQAAADEASAQAGPEAQPKAAAAAAAAEAASKPQGTASPEALAAAALAGAVAAGEEGASFSVSEASTTTTAAAATAAAEATTAPAAAEAASTTASTTTPQPEQVAAAAAAAAEQAEKAGVSPEQASKEVLRKVPAPDHMASLRFFRGEIQREADLDENRKAIFEIMLEQVERAVQRGEDILCGDLLNRVIALCSENADVPSLAALSQVCADFKSARQLTGSDVTLLQRSSPHELPTAYPGDDQAQIAFPEYRHLDPAVVRYLAQNLSFNRDKKAEQLYGQDMSGTPSQYGAAFGYVQTNNSGHINAYLRQNAASTFRSSSANPPPAPIPFASLRTIGLMDQATSSYRLPWKTRLHRMVKTTFLEQYFGIPEGDNISYTGQAVKTINEQAGTIINDPTIMSTGFYVDPMFATYPVMLTLLCDEGTPVFPSRNMAEGEIVLGRGTSYMILSAIAHTDVNPLNVPSAHLRTFDQYSTGYEGNLQTNSLEIFAKVLPTKEPERSLSQSDQKFQAFQQKQTAYVPRFQGDHGDEVHRNAYLAMARADQASLTEAEAAAMDEYTNDSGAINSRMRQGNTLSDVTGAQNALIRQAFAKHPIPVEIETYRGVSDGFLSFLLNSNPAFDEEVKANALLPGGKINHDWLDAGENFKIFENIVFQDAAFLSTSTNKPFARRWANNVVHDEITREQGGTVDYSDPARSADIAGAHVLTMHLPAGTRAMFTDTMFTRNGRPRGQDEVTLDAGYTYIIQSVTKVAPGRYEMDVRCLG